MMTAAKPNVATKVTASRTPTDRTSLRFRLRYSDLIADRLAGLAAVKGWDPDAVTFGAIGHKPWFL